MARNRVRPRTARDKFGLPNRRLHRERCARCTSDDPQTALTAEPESRRHADPGVAEILFADDERAVAQPVENDHPRHVGPFGDRCGPEGQLLGHLLTPIIDPIMHIMHGALI